MTRFRFLFATAVGSSVVLGCGGYTPAGSPGAADPALARGVAIADSLIGSSIGTNRQNMGTDAGGYFPDIGPLQQAVARAIVNGAAALR